MIGRRGWLSSFFLVTSLVAGPTVRADLVGYVKRLDDAFAWRQEAAQESAAGTAYSIRLTSQVWQGITWEHRLQIYEPAEIRYQDSVLLFITGGSTTSQPGPKDAEMGFGLAQLCGARCAVLHQVPNQPLLGGKTEDTLIAETFVRYLETKDESWPLLFPMVKSAVRAMDAVQDWAKEGRKAPIKRFVVSGASKRGWTTWLTAAVDDRVAAIAPMVIVMLNTKAQNEHQLKVFGGKYSEQIGDYERRGLLGGEDTPERVKLMGMIDPFTYRDRIAIPKLLINGTNDRYWTLDAMNLYWDGLKAPKYVTYVPNAGHGLEQHRDYATHGLAAMFRSVVSGHKLPELSWKHTDAGDGDLRLSVEATPTPKSVRVWVARGETRDFRDSPWEASPMHAAGPTLSAEVPRPAKGFVALFGDLEYEIDGLPYHLSTQIRQAGAGDRAE